MRMDWSSLGSAIVAASMQAHCCCSGEQRHRGRRQQRGEWIGGGGEGRRQDVAAVWSAQRSAAGESAVLVAPRHTDALADTQRCNQCRIQHGGTRGTVACDRCLLPRRLCSLLCWQHSGERSTGGRQGRITRSNTRPNEARRHRECVVSAGTMAATRSRGAPRANSSSHDVRLCIRRALAVPMPHTAARRRTIRSDRSVGVVPLLCSALLCGCAVTTRTARGMLLEVTAHSIAIVYVKHASGQTTEGRG